MRDNKELVDKMVQQGLLKVGLPETAMRTVDRGAFSADQRLAYRDVPHDIGHGQTISAPRIHALALSWLAKHAARPDARVLDVGSGSGYLSACFAAVLGEGGKVFGIDAIPELVEFSKRNLSKSGSLADRESESTGASEKETVLGSSRPGAPNQSPFADLVTVYVGDGWKGLPQEAPFDVIHVGAAAKEMPQALVDQLKPRGRMLIPIGEEAQDIVIVDKNSDGTIEQRKLGLMGVRYVPLIERNQPTSAER